MVNMYWPFATTKGFRVSVLNIGHADARIFLVQVNTVQVNTAMVFSGTGWGEATLPYVAAGLGAASIFSRTGLKRISGRLMWSRKKESSVRLKEAVRPAAHRHWLHQGELFSQVRYMVTDMSLRPDRVLHLGGWQGRCSRGRGRARAQTPYRRAAWD